MQENTLKIYIDGSAITNPGSIVGCAGVVVHPDRLSLEDIELDWSYDFGSSGSMELCALINALMWINENRAQLITQNITRVIIYSDSQYVVDGANRWIHSWYKSKWKKQDGSSVRNIPLWKLYLTERRKVRINISIEWHRGKSNQVTKNVDELAKRAARSFPTSINRKFIKPSVGKSLSGKSLGLSGDYSGPKENILIRVYYHAPIAGSVPPDREVRFEVLENGKVTGKFRSYAYPEVDGVLDRHHYYIATFSSSSSHSRIERVEELTGPDLEKIKEQTSS